MYFVVECKDEVGAELQRALKIGTHEGVVDHHAGVSLPRQVGDAGDIDKRHQRIGRSLEKDHRGFVAPCRLDVGDVSRIDVLEVETKVA